MFKNEKTSQFFMVFGISVLVKLKLFPLYAKFNLLIPSYLQSTCSYKYDHELVFQPSGHSTFSPSGQWAKTLFLTLATPAIKLRLPSVIEVII